MRRCRRTLSWLVVLLIPVLFCAATLAQEGSVKTKTKFLPKTEADTAPGIGPSLTVEDESGSKAECAPPGIVVLDEPLEPFLDLGSGIGTEPLSGMVPNAWDPLRFINVAIDRILNAIQSAGWYEGLRGDLETVSGQLSRYVGSQTIGGKDARAVIDALDELRAAAADLREAAKDETVIAELLEKAQPNNPEACPSTNRGWRALQRVANVLRNWQAVAEASNDPETTSELQTRLTGIFSEFFTRTEASSRWVSEQAQGLNEICDRIASTTKPVDGTNVSFGEWRSKVSLVEENLRWALDHADDPKNLSAVVFGLEMAKDFKESLERIHKKE